MGAAASLLAAADGRLGGPGGLLGRLAAFRAYDDPLAKKAQLLAKICERRGWFEVADPESWEVSADSVLMRLALRSGLVEPGALAEVRAATRAEFKRVAAGGLDPAAACSTTCSGSSAARIRTCSATRPATCASRRATPLRAGTRRPCEPRGNSRRSCG